MARTRAGPAAATPTPMAAQVTEEEDETHRKDAAVDIEDDKVEVVFGEGLGEQAGDEKAEEAERRQRAEAAKGGVSARARREGEELKGADDGECAQRLRLGPQGSHHHDHLREEEHSPHAHQLPPLETGPVPLEEEAKVPACGCEAQGVGPTEDGEEEEGGEEDGEDE